MAGRPRKTNDAERLGIDQKDCPVNLSELETMSIKELRVLKDHVDEALNVAIPREKAALKATLRAMASEHGIRLADLVDDGKPKKGSAKGSVVPIKFRNPSNPAETWTGRGRRPNWMTSKGGDIERFRVK